MGSDLPVLKPKEVVNILTNLGFVLTRQKGSHQQFRYSDWRATTIPIHNRDLSPILLRQICKDINITTNDFLKAK